MSGLSFRALTYFFVPHHLCFVLRLAPSGERQLLFIIGIGKLAQDTFVLKFGPGVPTFVAECGVVVLQDGVSLKKTVELVARIIIAQGTHFDAFFLGTNANGTRGVAASFPARGEETMFGYAFQERPESVAAGNQRNDVFKPRLAHFVVQNFRRRFNFRLDRTVFAVKPAVTGVFFVHDDFFQSEHVAKASDLCGLCYNLAAIFL